MVVKKTSKKKTTSKEVVKKSSTKKTKSKSVIAAEKSVAESAMQSIPANSMSDRSVTEYSSEALLDYGSYVVEERAVADFRDGLKPSHRAIMWSLNDLGLKPSAGYKKSARTVGDAIGKYHPHGDAGTYGAMVTIANTCPPLVDGQGNWGTPVDGNAAMRYTEAKMSKFAHTFLLDSKYLQVVPKIPNFSNDGEIPLFMPALLPYLLFNGSFPPPAYGVRAGNPSFTVKSVSKVVIDMLNGKEYSAKKLAKVLEITHPYGCENITNEKDYAEFIATGKGSIYYAPLRNYDYKKREINITSYVPSTLASKDGIEKKLNELVNLKGVSKAYSKRGKKAKGAGPYGALLVIEAQRSISEDDFYDLADKIDKKLVGSVPYRLGVTIRKVSDRNAFKYLSYETFFKAWIKYRISLELMLIKKLIETTERDLHVNSVYLYAVENMSKLLKVLPKVLMSKAPDKALAKALKMSVEDANIILDRKVRQLAKMEAGALKEKVNGFKSELNQLNKDLKDPGGRAAKDTAERVKSYLKKPDLHKSGLPIQ